jgi:hypothetical protein
MKVDEKQPLFLKFTSIKYVFHQQNIWDETQNQWLLRERPFNLFLYLNTVTVTAGTFEP